MFLEFWIVKFWIIKIVSDDDFSKAAFPWWKVKLSTIVWKKRSFEIIALSRAIGIRIGGRK